MMRDISHERFLCVEGKQIFRTCLPAPTPWSPAVIGRSCGDGPLDPNLSSSIRAMDRMQAFHTQIA